LAYFQRFFIEIPSTTQYNVFKVPKNLLNFLNGKSEILRSRWSLAKTEGRAFIRMTDGERVILRERKRPKNLFDHQQNFRNQLEVAQRFTHYLNIPEVAQWHKNQTSC
jgi:hypothetical protein